MGKSPTDIALSQKQAEEEKKAAEKRARTLLREVQRASIPCRASRRQAARRGRGTGSQPMLDAPPDAALLSQLQMNGFASQLGVSASARILSSTSAEATAAAAAGAGGAVNPSADRNALNDIAAMLAGASTLTDPPVTTSAQHQSAMVRPLIQLLLLMRVLINRHSFTCYTVLQICAQTFSTESVVCSGATESTSKRFCE